MAVLSRLLPVLTSAFALQVVLGLVFVPQQEDRFYDLSGAVGWLSTAFVSLYYPSLRASYLNRVTWTAPPLSSFAPRQLLISAALGIWSLRLGSFLATRAIKAGGDSRFDEIKRQPGTFMGFWLGQAAWISLVGLPAYLTNILPAARHPAFGIVDYASVALIAGSFLFEVVADRQKSAWRHAKENKQHDEKFITSGLWSVSRHPNYVGEVGIWAGMLGLSSTAVLSPYFPRGTIALAALSPLVTWYLLRKVSGVPPLENAGDRKFGDDPKWQEYKRNVPVFWPWSSAH